MNRIYTIEDLETDIAEINTFLAGIRQRKGNDYSGTGDTFDNIREFGSLGVLVRIGDKFKRLKHLLWEKVSQKVEDESVHDTIDDLINYAYYLKILLRQENGINIPKELGGEHD